MYGLGVHSFGGYLGYVYMCICVYVLCNTNVYVITLFAWSCLLCMLGTSYVQSATAGMSVSRPTPLEACITSYIPPISTYCTTKYVP
jgi:hypothetical protein